MKLRTVGRGRRVGRRTLPAALVALIIAVAGAGCAEDTAGTNDGGGDGVGPGATKQEYIDALAGMEPVTMTIPSSGPPDSLTSEPFEAYAAVLEEWSGGQITVEIGYSNSVADLAGSGDALRDGRLQWGQHAPIYQPDEYPANNAVVDHSFLATGGPLTSMLNSFGALIDIGVNTQELTEEISDAGFQPLLPLGGSSANVGIFCTDGPVETLEEMAGKQTRVSGAAHVGPMEALGMTPVSLDITELFEGLERGVVDCAEMLIKTAEVTGAAEAAKYMTLSGDVRLPATPTAYSVDQQFWDELPLAAKQLIWDRMDVWLESTLMTNMEFESGAVSSMLAAGGSVTEWDTSAAEALQEKNEELLEEAAGSLEGFADPEAFIDSLRSTYDKWSGIIEDLGYEDDGTLQELPTWYDSESTDLMPFVERVMEEVSGNRP